MASIGITFPPAQPPERLRDVATAADAAGIDDLWLWEDCFAESGMSTAAAALAWTQNLRVVVGLFPVPLRNVALTAMEIASIARLFPDRFLPGIGHGVLEWMGQVGARAASPLTLLREYGTALRRLLDGETVTTAGRYVTLEDVTLQWPPTSVPLLVGAHGPKTLALAGEIGDGIMLVGSEDLEVPVQAIATATQARAAAGIEAPFEIASALDVPVTIGADELAARIEALTAIGVTRVAVVGCSEDGPPDGSEQLLDLVETVAAVRRG